MTCTSPSNTAMSHLFIVIQWKWIIKRTHGRKPWEIKVCMESWQKTTQKKLCMDPAKEQELRWNGGQFSCSSMLCIDTAARWKMALISTLGSVLGSAISLFSWQWASHFTSLGNQSVGWKWQDVHLETRIMRTVHGTLGQCSQSPCLSSLSMKWWISLQSDNILQCYFLKSVADTQMKNYLNILINLEASVHMR